MKKITLFIVIVLSITAQAQDHLVSEVNYGANWSQDKDLNYTYQNSEVPSDNRAISTANKSYKISTYIENKVSEELCKNWNTTLNRLENSYLISYTYTGGNLTEIVSKRWENSNWEIDDKTVISYDSKNLLEAALFYHWNGSQWLIEEKVVVTYNKNNEVVADMTYLWNGNNWSEEESVDQNMAWMTE